MIPQCFCDGKKSGTRGRRCDIRDYENFVKGRTEGSHRHELSHIQHRDILVSTNCCNDCRCDQYVILYGSLGRYVLVEPDRVTTKEVVAAEIFSSFSSLSIFASIAAMLIQMAISRSREYLADEAGPISAIPFLWQRLWVSWRQLPNESHAGESLHGPYVYC